MGFCRILTKKTVVPEYLLDYVLDDDIVFEHTDFFVLVSDSESMSQAYDFSVEKPIIRLDKRVLRDLEDDELSVVFFRAKLEQDIMVMNQDFLMAVENADHVLWQRYSRELLRTVDRKLNRIFGD